MQFHWFVIPGINPIPYRNPTCTAQLRRGQSKGSKPICMGVKDDELRAYQLAITTWGISNNVPRLEEPYQLMCFWWRRRIRYQNENGRWVTKNLADQTNLLKATEDALQPSRDPKWDGVISNDSRDHFSGGLIVEQTLETEPLIVIQIASKVPDQQRVYVPVDLMQEAADGILEAQRSYAARVAATDDNRND